MRSLQERLTGVPVTLLIGLVRAYRFFLSPWLGSSCRFEPTCSAYSLQALQMHGASAGTYLTLRRLVRCHPWCEGGNDPVPARLFTRFSTVAGRAPTPHPSPLDKTSP